MARARVADSVSYFERRSIPEPNTGCWLWLGAAQWSGYGVIRTRQKTARAHRAAYEAATGNRLPSSIDVCHRCDNPACVNPDHLFAGSRTDNMRDCSNKGRLRLPTLIGEACPAAKLSSADVLAIRTDSRSQRVLGRLYGVDKGTIAAIRNRTTWRHL